MQVLLLTPLLLGASPLPSPCIFLLSDRALEPYGLQACWLSRVPRSLCRGLARVEEKGRPDTLCSQVFTSLPPTPHPHPPVPPGDARNSRFGCRK